VERRSLTARSRASSHSQADLMDGRLSSAARASSSTTLRRSQMGVRRSRPRRRRGRGRIGTIGMSPRRSRGRPPRRRSHPWQTNPIARLWGLGPAAVRIAFRPGRPGRQPARRELRPDPPAASIRPLGHARSIGVRSRVLEQIRSLPYVWLQWGVLDFEPRARRPLNGFRRVRSTDWSRDEPARPIQVSRAAAPARAARLCAFPR
jgi:hypothetical protein